MLKLSPYHEIFYTEWKLNPARGDYNIVVDNNLYGIMDPKHLGEVFQRLSQDFFLLHSCICSTAEGSYWVEQPELAIAFDYIEVPQTPAELLAYVKAPFNLETGPLLRARLLKLGAEHFRFIIVVHHIIMDGAKINFIFETVSRYYNESAYRCELSLKEQAEKLEQLSQHLRAQLAENETNHTEFWREHLSDLSGPDIRFLKTSPHSTVNCEENNVGEYLFTFNGDILKQLRRAARKYQITPFILSQTIFASILYRYTGQEEFGLCMPVAIRDGADFIYGVHVSPIILKYQFSAAASLASVIENTKSYFKSVKAGFHQYFQLQKLLLTFVSKSLVEIAFTQTNLKNQLFGFINIHQETINTALNIDLAGKLLFAQEIKHEQVFYRVLYDKEHIDAHLLHQFIQTYQRLLPEIVADLLHEKAQRTINDYPLLTPQQYQLLIVEWNQTDQPYPENKTLHQLFEEQVEQTPQRIAVTYEGIDLSYATLNQQANQLAHYIKSQIKVEPDDFIGLCFYPSHHMIVALWAVLKVGAAYVPIDPNYPGERIAYIIQNAKAKLVLTDQQLLVQLIPICQLQNTTVLAADERLVCANQPDTNPIHSGNNRNLAYVIYTSGTTGKPKGVLIEHRSTVNYVNFLISHNQLSENSVGAKYASFGFDASVIEIYPILLSGGKLCILKEKDRLDYDRVNCFFEQYGVTYAFLPPAVAELFCELENSSLKNLIVGGEQLKKLKYPQKYHITNAYGPTEATVQSTAFTVQSDQYPVPIGKPIQNVKCYILDKNLNLLPIGAIGELCIGGENLARGYLYEPSLTREKFIANPFQTLQEKHRQRNARIYKTGDLARWLPDGNLEYIGRNDSQVKIRGYRIELSEIENQFMHYPGIRQVLVVALNEAEQQNSETKLVVYYASNKVCNDSDIRAYLNKHLPEFMVPTTYIYLPRLPVNANGKLDQSLLPKPELSRRKNYTPPSTAIEKIVCAIYAQILRLPEQQVGIHDSFFQLGGNSLTTVYLARHLSQYFTILVTDIYRLETPANIIRELPLVPTYLHKKIQQIKSLYVNAGNFLKQDWEKITDKPDLMQKYNQYLAKIKHLQPDVTSKKSIESVLLTGATGYLGCNLLEKLLTETLYTIYLPIRALSDQEAYSRIQQKFQFYFDQDLTGYANRIIVFAANLEDEYLGLNVTSYQNLIPKINNVIHCAALVKYYGKYDEFYRANVQTTANLLTFTQLTSHPDFHYISTLGVLIDGYIENQDYYIFTEEDSLAQFIPGTHPYIRSKYAAEQLVIAAQKNGLTGTIYRVGNLVMHSQTYRIQQDFEKNFFFSHIRAALQFGILPTEMSHLEVSLVDYTALAIVKLFDKSNLSNQIYHLFDSAPCNLGKILSKYGLVTIRSDQFELFVEKVLSAIDYTPAPDDLPHLLTIYQFWLQEVDARRPTAIRISTQKTRAILEKLNFYWPTVTAEMFTDFINKAIAVT